MAPSKQDQYDSAFLSILQNEGEIMKFIEAVYGFLYRRTDFYIEQNENNPKMGFPPGIAMKITSAVFHKYNEMAKKDQERKNKLSTKAKQQISEVNISAPDSKQNDDSDENKSSLQTDPTISKAASSNVEESKQTETPVNHAIELEKVTNKPTKEKDKKSGNESDEDPELTRMQKIYQDNPCSHNGAMRDNYSWGQSIADVDAYINIPKPVKKGKDVIVSIERQHLKASYRGADGNMIEVVNDKLSWPINKENSLWTLVPSEHIHINLEKVQERWWESLLDSEEKISVRKINPSRPMTDLDDESQSKIEEMMYNQRQKELGLPQSHEQKAHEMLKGAWDADGSPFKGQPFDTSSFKFS